jgi:hypothetical protein
VIVASGTSSFVRLAQAAGAWADWATAATAEAAKNSAVMNSMPLNAIIILAGG